MSIEIRYGVIGNVDAGKSTLTSVLVNGVNDDGRGSARELVFNHKHERDNGRTSSVSQNSFHSARVFYPKHSSENPWLVSLVSRDNWQKAESWCS